MTNMSYCRFENTVTDLIDCEYCVGDMDLSDRENKKRIQLIEVCRRIALQFDGADIDEEFKDNSDSEDEYDEEEEARAE